MDLFIVTFCMPEFRFVSETPFLEYYANTSDVAMTECILAASI